MRYFCNLLKILRFKLYSYRTFVDLRWLAQSSFLLFYSYLLVLDSCWLVLIRVGLVLTRVDSCRTRVDSCWFVSDSCWFVLNSCKLVLILVGLVLIRVDPCWYSCIRIDLILNYSIRGTLMILLWTAAINTYYRNR